MNKLNLILTKHLKIKKKKKVIKESDVALVVFSNSINYIIVTFERTLLS